jgi:hypothetical protein
LPDAVLVAMGRSARDNVERRFSEQAYLARLSDVYQRFNVAL